jgi:hypothetical protein
MTNNVSLYTYVVLSFCIVCNMYTYHNVFVAYTIFIYSNS